MNKKCLLVFVGLLFFSGSALATESSDFLRHDSSGIGKKGSFLTSIETGEAPWINFVSAIRGHQIMFTEISPSAVANYLEAFANEGLLELIPSQYFYHEEIKLSLDVVFEDPENICNNPSAYKDHMQ